MHFVNRVHEILFEVLGIWNIVSGFPTYLQVTGKIRKGRGKNLRVPKQAASARGLGPPPPQKKN